jgi:hypothetical protein
VADGYAAPSEWASSTASSAWAAAGSVPHPLPTGHDERYRLAAVTALIFAEKSLPIGRRLPAPPHSRSWSTARRDLRASALPMTMDSDASMEMSEMDANGAPAMDEASGMSDMDASQE